MLHIGAKTYMQVDQLIDLRYDRIVISETHGVPMLQMLDAVTSGTLINYAQSVEDMIGAGKPYADYEDFFRFLFNRNTDQIPVMIYADAQSFMKLASALFKIIFVSIDTASAYRLLSAYFEKMLLVGPRMSREARVIFSEFRDLETEFNTIFESITVDPTKSLALVTDYGDQLSVEYLLASYAYDGSQKSALKAAVNKMAGRAVEEQLKELLYIFYRNFLISDFQTKLGIGNYNVDNAGSVLDEPILAPLIKANEWRSTTATPTAPRPQFNLGTFTDQEIADLIAVSNKIIEAFYGAALVETFSSHNRLNYIAYLRTGTLSDENLDNIINNEVSDTFEERLWSAKDIDSVNIFFADYVLEQMRSSSMSNLAPYHIRS
jgi:hypothetical protein